MRHEHAAARVRRRITEWVEREGHGSRTRLAKAVKGLYGKKRSGSWVTDIIDGPDKGGQDLRLRDLDAVAEAMGVPPGDLVCGAENVYAEITPSELRILRFFRALPEVARHHFVGWLDHLADLQTKFLQAQAEERDQRTETARRQRAAMDRKPKNVQRSGRGPLLRSPQPGPYLRHERPRSGDGDGDGGESAH